MECKRCKSENTYKNGKAAKSGKQQYRCKDCGYSFEEGKYNKSNFGMSLEEFRDKHDVEFIITKTLSKMDKNMIYEKSDIVKMSGLPYGAQGLTNILESKKEYYGKISGKVYYSHPDTIKMLKEQAKLN